MSPRRQKEMKIIQITLLFSIFLSIGCQSIEDQKRFFKETYDYQIGKPYYSVEKEGMKEVELSVTESEFIPQAVSEGDAGVAWTVDTSQRGTFEHAHGHEYEIEGIKTSWRIVGNSDAARFKTYWWHPW
jgi:hypothetical protein